MRPDTLTVLRQALDALGIEPRGVRHPWGGDQYTARSKARIALMEEIAALERAARVTAQAEAPRCSCGRKGPHDCSSISDLDGVAHV